MLLCSLLIESELHDGLWATADVAAAVADSEEDGGDATATPKQGCDYPRSAFREIHLNDLLCQSSQTDQQNESLTSPSTIVGLSFIPSHEWVLLSIARHHLHASCDYLTLATRVDCWGIALTNPAALQLRYKVEPHLMKP